MITVQNCVVALTGITCGNPGQPTNGQATSTGYDFEKTVRYTCNRGYKMENIPSGVLIVTCKGTGLWSQAKPTCQRKCYSVQLDLG